MAQAAFSSEPKSSPGLQEPSLGQLKQMLKELETQLAHEKERREDLQRLIDQNPDTALPIYRLFYSELERLIEYNQNGHSRPFAVGLVRLDSAYQRIKNTRDRSKALLFKTTIRIREVIGDALYQSDRLDEFYVLLRDYTSPAELHRLFFTVLREVSKPFEAPAEDLSFSCLIGFSQYPKDGLKSSELILNAEIALKYGVSRHKPIVEFSTRLGEAFYRANRLELELHAATQTGFDHFQLVYQPFVDEHHTMKGCESLIRWNHPEFGKISPQQFIPIAERTGDIRIFGRWILYKSLLQLKQWHAMGFPEYFISVNLSPVQFTQRDLVEHIVETLETVGLDGRYLKLEITEGAIMTDPGASVKKLGELRDRGIRISIDDFGTGYSSLNYLMRLPIDTLKIDKSFVDGVIGNQQNQEIVRAIISMAKSLRVETLAEGVETREQRDFLISEGCQFIQGYYYSPPVEADTFNYYLRKGAVLPIERPKT